METTVSFYPDGPNDGGVGTTSRVEAVAAIEGGAYVLRIVDAEVSVAMEMSLDELKRLLVAWGL